jgi:hypothetical protein
MAEHLSTHTWPYRNIHPLKHLETILSQRGKKDITVLDVGPGGIASKYATILPKGDQAGMRFWAMKKKQAINWLESPARDHEDCELTCFEPYEIHELLSERIGIKEMIVADKNPRVLEAVEKLRLKNTRTLLWNIEKGPYTGLPVDVAICFFTIEYCEDQLQACNFLCNAIKDKDGGFLVAGFTEEKEIYIPEFTRIKPAREDKLKRYIYWKGKMSDVQQSVWGRKAPSINETLLEPYIRGPISERLK